MTLVCKDCFDMLSLSHDDHLWATRCDLNQFFCLYERLRIVSNP